MKIIKQDKVLENGWTQGRGGSSERWSEKVSLRISEP